MKAVLQWVLRTMMKDQTGIVRTMPKKDLVDFNVAMTAERLMRNGIDPNSLKNANQVENAINQIEAPRNVQQGIKSTKSAKIMDMEGKEIDPRSKIMGGKQAETEEEILERLNKENKEGIESLKQKMAKEKSRTQRISGNLRADNASRTEIGRPKLDEDEYDYYREILGENAEYDYYPVKGDETKEMLEAMVKEQKDEMAYMKKLYDKGALDDPDKMATGGRAGFVAGGIINLAMRLARGFMKVTGRKPNDEEFMKIIREAAERDFAEVSDDVALKGVSETRATARRMDSIDKDELKKAIDEYKIPVRTQEEFDFAQGGIARLGLKEGSGMTRRTFLKLLGGMAAVPIVGKFFKLAKVGQKVKQVPMIKTDDVAGKPEWFDALVNKVIREGDEVTKKFATGERQSIHQKTLDDGSVVRVTEDVDDGAIRVEYQSEKNVFGDDVQLEYKKPLPDEGDPRPTAEFTTAESGPVGRGGRSPDGDDFEIDVDEVGGTSIRDLDSDVSKLKEYATGKKPTMKEIVQNKKRRDKAEAITEDPEAQMDAVIRRQGEYTGPFDDDFASGGIARMLGE